MAFSFGSSCILTAGHRRCWRNAGSDPATGAFVNAELANYKLCRIGDVGEVVVELFEPEDQRSRGVIGLGEPPVIAPGAAISNAVANALGVRVPVLPLTPQRVLAALKAKA